MKVAIVILNYNGRHHLEDFLPSVLAHCPAYAEVIVADNASTDDSVAWLATHHPELRVIALPQNFGFAGGYNRALEQVNAPFYALVNSDLEVTEDWLDPLIDQLENDPTIAAAQPKIRDFNQRDHFEYAGASGGFIDRNGYPFCRGRIFGHCERDIGQHDDVREVFWATGACMLVRAEAFHQVEGFDDHLFAHMEEIDLCWRMKNQGWTVFCVPTSTVYHLGGGTLATYHPRKTFLNFRNNLSVMIKNDYADWFWLRLLKRMVLDGAAALYLFFERGPRHSLALLQAHFSLYGRMRSHLRGRKLWKARANHINLTGKYTGNIVFDFYLNKKRVFSALQNAYFVRKPRRF